MGYQVQYKVSLDQDEGLKLEAMSKDNQLSARILKRISSSLLWIKGQILDWTINRSHPHWMQQPRPLRESQKTMLPMG